MKRLILTLIFLTLSTGCVALQPECPELFDMGTPSNDDTKVLEIWV